MRLALAAILVATALVALVPQCANEDSSNCLWNASVSGNGIGQSFIDIAGIAYYLP